MFQCFNVSIFQYFNVSIFQSFNISMFQYFNLSIFQCFNVSIFQCFNYLFIHMKKTVITIIISIIAITGGVFAHDCELVVNNNIDTVLYNYKNNYNEYTQFLPAEAFHQALINLKAYCCAQVVNPPCTDKEKANLPKKYMESAYLFDHLIDISMRRLDGNKALAYGLEPDPTGSERRTKINEIASTTTGIPANEIEKIYKSYRTLHENENFDITKYNAGNSATFSLRDKYNTLCPTIKNLYEDIKGGTNDIIIWWYLDENSFFNGCENLVQKRVEKENGYIKILMVQKSNQLLNESMKAFTQKHFVEEKLMALWNLILKVKTVFQTIVLQAPTSTSCSQ